MAKEDLTKVDPKKRGTVSNDETMGTVSTKRKSKVFDGKKRAKSGTEKRPAVVRVQTEKRMKEVASIFAEHGWKYIIRLEPDKPEDIVDLERLLNPSKPKIAEQRVGRNDPCPCGSGKKFKKCCGK